MRSLRRGSWALAVLLVSLGLTPSVPRAPMALASNAAAVAVTAAREDAIRTSTSTTYRVAAASAQGVEVLVRITLTNEQPDVVDGGSVRRYYLDRYGVPVLGEAEAFTATRDGVSLAVSRIPRPGVPMAVASIDLVPNLFYGDSQTIELRYRIPARPPRSGGFSRVNAAYVTFPAFASGDPGATDIEVVVPDTYEVEVIGSALEAVEMGDSVVYRAEDIADPAAFMANVVARNDDALVTVPVRFGDRRLTVLGWPGDDAWVEFVAGTVERGVPVLEELIDLPWPGADDLEVIETASPYLYGYAGWYSPSEALVAIGDELDGGVILHELSHLWFSHRLFRERWINEGLAEVYSALALDRLGEPIPGPEPVDATDPGRIPLLDWSDPDLQQPISKAQEAYGYNAAHAVLDGVVGEIGTTAMARVLVAAEARAVAYPGDGEPLRYPTALGWRELLDLLEGTGESTTAASRFVEVVLPADEQSLLADRAEARLRYDRLVADGDGWTAPRGLRQAMARWRFDEAQRLADAAEVVLESRGVAAEVLAAVEVPPPAGLEDVYEGAMTGRDLALAADGAVEASGAVAGAVLARRAASGPLGTIGSLGGSASGRLADARAALDDGDFAAAADDARAAIVAYRSASANGALRLAAVTAGLVVVVWWRRGRRAALVGLRSAVDPSER